jgi:hypothetical protein
MGKSEEMKPSMLLDLEEIRRLKSSYGRLVDGVVSRTAGIAVDEFDDIFTEDVKANFIGVLGRFEGRAAVKDLFANNLAKSRSSMWHTFSNSIIDINGDVATAEWTILALVKRTGRENEPPDQTYGRYQDRYVRTPHGWRIKEFQFQPVT